MAVSVPTSLTRRRRRTSYRRPRLRLVEAPPRPAAHRARYSKAQLDAIRRRRTRVLAVQAWVGSNVRLIVAAIAATAVFATATVFMLGLADDTVRTLLGFGFVVVFLAVSLHQIATYTTEETR